MWRAQREEGGGSSLSPVSPLYPHSPLSLSRLPHSWRWPQRFAPAAARMCSCDPSKRLSEAPFVCSNKRHSSDLSLSTISCSLRLIFCLPTNNRVKNTEKTRGRERSFTSSLSFWKKRRWKSRGDIKSWVWFYIRKKSESKIYFYVRKPIEGQHESCSKTFPFSLTNTIHDGLDWDPHV